METILSDLTASITELKTNPMQVIEKACGEPVAILNRNKPAFYCIPPEAYEALLDKLDDMKLVEIIRQREGQKRIRVSLDDL